MIKKWKKRNAKDDKNIQTADEEEYQPKKVDAPKPKNLSNKIQFKAMDAEAKQLKKMGEKEQKGQERANAIKAVSQLPKNIIDNIKKQIKKIDEKDDKTEKEIYDRTWISEKSISKFEIVIIIWKCCTNEIGVASSNSGFFVILVKKKIEEFEMNY